MNQTKINIGIAVLCAVIIAGAILLSFSRGNLNVGGAPQGMMSNSATTSILTATTTVFNLFATSSSCVSRIITTNKSALYFTIADQLGQSPAGNGLGHFQATGTTAVYDSALYGCGLWRGTTTIATDVTVSEFRGFR